MKVSTIVGCLLAGASVSAIVSAASAQEVAAASEQAQDTVVITGSRIQRDGFKTPTPVTVLTSEDLESRAASNIADALNTLPQFQNSISNQQASTFSAAGNPQGNYLNLRGLGVNRSLILLDGVRVPPTNASGGVDLNMLPQALIERVDVITGGASAAYGSDAMVGVVNFILDTDFTGLKASVQASASSRGDAEAYKATLAAGMSFADGAGHVLFSAEHYQIDGLTQGDRPRGSDRILTVGTANATNPYRVISDARYPTMAFGGFIGSGPLANNYFRADGTLAPFNPGVGTGAGSAIVQGGDGAYHPDTQSLTSGLSTDQAFARVSYDFSDTLRAHAQATFGESRNTFDVGAISFTPAQLRIFSDNAFLTPAIRTSLGATPSFTFGTLRRDLPLSAVDLLNTTHTLKLGLEGDLGDGWSWDASYVYGDSKQRQASLEANLINFYAGVDAVVGPNGNVICRAAIADPARFGNCVPINLFGEGNVTSAAVDYLRTPSQFEVNNNMQIVAANVYGDVFSTWAGPVSVAAGLEARRQTLQQSSNGDPAIPRNFGTIRGVPAGSLWFGRQNAGVAQGEVEVSEGYVEAAVPLARNLPWAKDIDLNLAVRLTDYSTSGSVTTWKAGVSYRPSDDLLIRSTVSRDIAAPGLSQLFAGLQAGPSSAATPDVHTNSTGTYLIQTLGNPSLRPEVGSMVVAGFVYTPDWLPGFSASIDATSLLIEDAILVQNQGQIITDCEASNGLGPSCALVIRPFPFENRTPANFPTVVNVVPLNLSKQFQLGADIEISYQAPVSQVFASLPGDFAVRALATYTPTNDRRLSAFNPKQESAGGTFGGDLVTDGFPIWRGSLDFSYNNGPLSVSVTERFTGSYKRDFFQAFADTKVAPNVAYTDVSVKYKWGEDEKFESILAVENLFNEEPPLIPSAQNPGLQYPTNKRHYDVLGTYITLGLRYRD